MTTEEILKFGLEVFNNEEEKFERWLYETNISLGSVKPIFLIFTDKGKEEVIKCLYRIEYGNLC